MGEMVRKGETLLYFYVTREDLFERAADAFKRAVVIAGTPPAKAPCIWRGNSRRDREALICVNFAKIYPN